MKKIQYAVALAFMALALTFTEAAAKHLDHNALMSLQPSPNVNDAEHGGVGIFVYDGMNSLDALGPMQTFSAAGMKPFLIAKKAGSVTASNGLKIDVKKGIADVTKLGILVVSGGATSTAAQANDVEILNWIKAIDETTVYTASVCTGSWILGSAGLLEGKKATSNWYRADEILKKFGAIPKSKERYVFDGKLVTSAGVTAGIDMSLAIIKKLYSKDLNNGKDFTQAVMLDLQYAPKPPVSGGSPAKTEKSVYEGMQLMYDMYLNGEPPYDAIKTLEIHDVSGDLPEPNSSSSTAPEVCTPPQKWNAEMGHCMSMSM
jgi:putative intracellular protease/amidase